VKAKDLTMGVSCLVNFILKNETKCDKCKYYCLCEDMINLLSKHKYDFSRGSNFRRKE